MQMGETQAETPQPEPEQEALRQEAARRAANRPAWFGRRQTAQNDSQEAARRAAQALAAAPRAPEAPAAPKVDEPTGTRTIAIPKQRTVSRPAEPAPEATRVMSAAPPQPTPAEPAPQPAALPSQNSVLYPARRNRPPSRAKTPCPAAAPRPKMT